MTLTPEPSAPAPVQLFIVAGTVTVTYSNHRSMQAQAPQVTVIAHPVWATDEQEALSRVHEKYDVYDRYTARVAFDLTACETLGTPPPPPCGP